MNKNLYSVSFRIKETKKESVVRDYEHKGVLSESMKIKIRLYECKRVWNRPPNKKVGTKMEMVNNEVYNFIEKSK